MSRRSPEDTITRELGLTAAERAGAATPGVELDLLLNHVGAPLQERADREGEDLLHRILVVRRRRSAVPASAAPGEAAALNQRTTSGSSALPSRVMAWIATVVVRIERVEAAEHVRGLAEDQAELRPIQTDVLESQQRTAVLLGLFHPFSANLHPGDRGTRLYSPLELQQLDVQVRGFRQLGLEGLETLEFGDFSRFVAGRGSAWFWHAAILLRSALGLRLSA